MAVVILGPWDRVEDVFLSDSWGNQVYEWALELEEDEVGDWNDEPSGEDTEEAPYDDSKDHDPCPDCNKSGKNPDAGFYVPLVGPRIVCDRCDGSGRV